MKTSLSILLLLLIKYSFAQDIHFSQNFVDRIYFNPSLVGNLVDSDYRLSMQRRSQWRSVSVPFSTFSVSFENKKFYKKFNVGLQFLNDRSGDSKMTLNQISLAISRNIPILNVNTLSLGGFLGLGQKKIDYSNLFFEEYENILSNNFIYPDIGLGLSYSTNPYEIMNYNITIASYHINNPNYSFNDDESVTLMLKNNFSIGANYKYRNDILISSELIISQQSTQQEILFGIRPKIQANDITICPLAYYRLDDAAIIGIGIEKDNIQANISYDINTSDLSYASQHKGGFEFSFIYLWNKKREKSIEIKDVICPKYL